MDRRQIAIEFANSLNFSEIKKIILFGSVARGDDNKDSDIDIMIITTDKDKIEDEVFSKVSDFLLETMKYISVKIVSFNHYNKFKDFSFYSTVNKEGILIG
ncbi:MAG: nucleotidyltransferase domain-containing protein [Methanobrevibacter sp.]|jgi:predicted nucleotidyltransferase|nr:nucleotidyltransferase domain-containing protein [Candidatus Methanovirga meridionalis]